MFYVLHGEDTFTRDERLATLRARMGDQDMAELNTTFLDGRTLSWDELVYQCDSLPFMSDRRLVIVHGLLGRLSQRNLGTGDAELLERLLAYLPDLAPTTRLVFVEETLLPEQHPVVSLARAADPRRVIQSTLPKNRDLGGWIAARVRTQGGEIEPAGAQALGAFVGTDLHQLQNEIDKLLAYTNGERAISEADVTLLTPQARQASVFALVDALGERDGREATRVYHALLNTGDHPLAILGMIIRQFRLMVQVKELLPKLLTPHAIARELRQNPYPIGKIAAQSRHFTMHQLRAVYHALADTDTQIKTGRLEATLALDALVGELCAIS